MVDFPLAEALQPAAAGLHRNRGLPSVLVLVVSCLANQAHWPEISRAIRGFGADEGNALLLSAALNKTQPFALRPVDMSLRSLHVRAHDTYLGLAEKMFMAWHAIASMPALSHVTHVLKLDDTDILDGKWTGLDVGTLQLALRHNQSLAAHHYAATSQPVTAYFPPVPGQQCGSATLVQYENYTVGPGVRFDMLANCADGHTSTLDAPEDSYWRQMAVIDAVTCHDFRRCTAPVAWHRGDAGYLLSRHAIEMATSVWRIGEVETGDLYRADAFEDVALSRALHHRCIAPESVQLPGVSHVTTSALRVSSASPRIGHDGLRQREGRTEPSHQSALGVSHNSTCDALLLLELHEATEPPPRLACPRCQVGEPGWCCSHVALPAQSRGSQDDVRGRASRTRQAAVAHALSPTRETFVQTNSAETRNASSTLDSTQCFPLEPYLVAAVLAALAVATLAAGMYLLRRTRQAAHLRQGDAQEGSKSHHPHGTPTGPHQARWDPPRDPPTPMGPPRDPSNPHGTPPCG
jgi:hypothetical protein